VIGSMEDLSAATLDDVKMFFRTYYSPSNAVLVVAGDIDVPATRQLVRRHFGWIPRGPAKPPVANAPLPPVLGAAQRQVVPDQQAPAPAVYVAFRVPPARSAQSPVVSLLGSVIADGRSGRLYEKLVREQQVATNVFGGNFGLVDGADMLFFAAVGKPGANADSLERALLAELDRAARGEFTQAELDRVRAGARFGFVNGLQTMGGFGGRADRLAEGWTHYRDPNYVNTWLGKLDRVTVAQLGALAKERMGENNRATLVFVPSKQATTTAEVKP
jgi:zinc protease